MSIQSQLSRVAYNVSDTLSAINEMGGTLPANATSDDMAAGVRSITTGAAIDDATVSTTKTYSSSKIEARFAEIGTQEEIVQQVIAALGTPVFGTVDEDNNIILSGELASGTYTLKYEDADGNLTEIGTLKKGSSYTNMIPLSINSDGSEYVGANGEDGYKTDTRLNSSSVESTSNATGYCVTGFIPVKPGDVIYFKNVNYTPGTSDSGAYIASYDSTYTKINSTTVQSGSLTEGHSAYKPVTTYSDTGYIESVTLSDGTLPYAYIRISAKGINADSIITVNEPITEQGTSSEPEIAYTNQIAASINSDGSEFVGTNGEDGYKTNTRLNSSGVEATLAGSGVTGFIPIKQYDVVRLQGIAIKPGTSSSGNYIAFYDASFAKITAIKMDSVTGTTYDYIFGSRVLDADGNLTQFIFFDDQAKGYAYMRVSCEAGITADSIITVNEEITD